MLADHGGELKAVELGHADVDQDDGDLVLEQMLQRLRAEAALIRFSPRSARIVS